MRSAEENKLEKDLRKWFNKLQRRIQKLIDTYYEDELFFLHINKVYTIVEEMKPEYRAILLKHGLTQFYNARETTTTLYTIQQKKVSTKAGLYEPQLIREEDVGLFRTNPQIEDSLRYNTFQASDKTLNRVTENITNNLADSYHEGLGIRDAGRRITKEFSSLKGWESRRIARTEINSAQNEGAFSAYDELGVEYQMWWTGKDNRVRDSHRPLHGHIVAVGNTFSNGLLYPGDKSGPIKEWINCRCTSIPYILPLGKMAPPGLTEFTEDQLIDIPSYKPVTVEEALNGEYPLEYHTEGGVIDQYRMGSKINERNAMLYSVPIKESLMKNQFAVPTEDLSEFGITEKGLETIQRIQKRNFGESKEFGFRFDEKTGKLLSDEFEGNGKNVYIPPSKRGEYSTIHNHTGDSLNPPSADDFYTYLTHKRENVAINLSRNESWFIKSDKLNSKKINDICQKVYDVEVKQIQKLNREYEKLKVKVKQGKMTQSELDEYLANEFLNKHNKELGDDLLKELSGIKGLKVRRVFNDQSVKPEIIEDLKDIKTVKPKTKSKYLRKSPQINGYDNYALTEAETKQYEKLKKMEGGGNLRGKEKRVLRELRDRKEFNELRNKILIEGGNPNDVFALYGEDGVKYEKLYDKFKDWVPKSKIEIQPVEINKKELFNNEESFKLNSTEKTMFKQLKGNQKNLSVKENNYFKELRDKNSLNLLHKKLISEGLDKLESDMYIGLYSKYKKKWNLPDLSLDLKFTTKELQYQTESYYNEATKFKLTKKENEELYKLEKKELFGQKLSSKELKRKELLQAQDKFAYLYELKKQHSGLDYKRYSEFKKLYKQVKTKLKLDKSILEQPLSNYKSNIPLNTDVKNPKRFKGTTDDGLLPNGEKITDYFTKDARDMTVREQKVAQRWMGKEYTFFTEMDVTSARDVDIFVENCMDKAEKYRKYKKNPEKYSEYQGYKKYYGKAITDNKGNILIKQSKEKFKEYGKGILHDLPVLDDILNNQLKQDMLLFRVQEHLYLGDNPQVGDIVDFANSRSTAISKEGALWFSKTNSKEMKYLIEIEAPVGTKGAYLAPIKTGEIAHGDYEGEKYAREMEFLLKKSKVEIVEMGKRKVKGANGESLKVVKLRIVES